MRTPCYRTKNKAFTNPTEAHPRAIAAAQKMCAQCPLLQDCAKEALTSGTSLSKDHRAPANDVIQAGVHCTGDIETAYKLAAIAKTEVPNFLTEETRRTAAPDQCRHCHRKMIRWHRGKTPDGYVMHRGRGFCTKCRKAYDADLKANPPKPRGLQKQIDRKRHSAPKRHDREPVVQLSLFGGEVLSA